MYKGGIFDFCKCQLQPYDHEYIVVFVERERERDHCFLWHRCQKLMICASDKACFVLHPLRLHSIWHPIVLEVCLRHEKGQT